jgi:hypothetical protein
MSKTTKSTTGAKATSKAKPKPMDKIRETLVKMITAKDNKNG